MCKRDVANRTYGPKREVKVIFDGEVPKLPDLLAKAKEFVEAKEEEEVAVAKYVPHLFEWKWLDPEESHSEKVGKKKKKEVQFKTINADLRKMPFLLKDGDIIGVRQEKDNVDKDDDFQTEWDKIEKEKFTANQEKERKERQKNQNKNRNNEPERGIVINLEEEEANQMLIMQLQMEDAIELDNQNN
eukprot:CAMPEP_0202964392 /NCGR_PEP_ID=MMETSP1396-20130829/8464_1 /ASSEMBLY_ACC=CAM_ASM_000872 /TAXON_ID= /ORGANISM="Pseudokeronopsis sp., Strain Brazil" /LENGTH=186 /DNA_ID=CAMNT_0049686453 /DNA_START=3178 /DNA_END=3738 /DNA_ORIENTATION=+